MNPNKLRKLHCFESVKFENYLRSKRQGKKAKAGTVEGGSRGRGY